MARRLQNICIGFTKCDRGCRQLPPAGSGSSRRTHLQCVSFQEPCCICLQTATTGPAANPQHSPSAANCCFVSRRSALVFQFIARKVIPVFLIDTTAAVNSFCPGPLEVEGPLRFKGRMKNIYQRIKKIQQSSKHCVKQPVAVDAACMEPHRPAICAIKWHSGREQQPCFFTQLADASNCPARLKSRRRRQTLS